MKVAVFDTHSFDRNYLDVANNGRHNLIFIEVRLSEQTALLAQGCQAVCCFANDKLDAPTLKKLKDLGINFIALRSAGYNQVDLKTAKELNQTVVRVPEYSPYAVAEYAAGMLLTLNRKIHKAHNRVHEMNFSLDGLVGFDLHGKTIGVVGTGRIGKAFGQIMRGFGCQVLAYDANPDQEWAQKNNIMFVAKEIIFSQSDIISLHIPLNRLTQHFLDAPAIAHMKKDVIIVNTGRGALIDTKALINALKLRLIGGACLDVYEEEAGVFFSDLSEKGITDDILARLLTFPNVLITSHQGFLTKEALKNIAEKTISSLTRFETNLDLSEVEVKA